ncbi:DUF6383 domain-containing protein [Parabacteroides sp.]
MNKKFSTLVAVLLAAGAWTTLDAKVVQIPTPVAGSTYLLGTGITNQGFAKALLCEANGTLSFNELAEALASTEGWELEVLGSIIHLKSNGKYAVIDDSGANTAVTMGAGSGNAGQADYKVDFELQGNKLVVAASWGATSNAAKKSYELSVANNGTLSLVEASVGGTEFDFGVYSEDAYNNLPGLDGVKTTLGVVDLTTLDATENIAAPFYIKTAANKFLTVEASGEGYAMVATDELPTSVSASESLNASWRWVNGTLVSVAAERAGKTFALKVAAGPEYSVDASGSAFTIVDGVLTADATITLASVELQVSATSVAADANVTLTETGVVVDASNLPLLTSVPSGYCLVKVGNQYLKADKAAGTTSFANFAAGTAAAPTYDQFLWKVSRASGGTAKYTYSFTSLAEKTGTKDAIKWDINGSTVFEATTGALNGLTLTNGGALVTNGGTERAIVAFYQAPIAAQTLGDLNAILNPGFEVTLKKTKDGKETIEGAEMFNGHKMFAVDKAYYTAGTTGSANETATTVMLLDRATPDAKANILVLDKDATIGSGDATVNGAFKWVTKKAFDADQDKDKNYVAEFQFTYDLSDPSTDMISALKIGDATAYILKVKDEYILTSLATVKDDTELPYIKLAASNVYPVKELVGQFLSFTYADTRANAKENDEEYKLGGILSVVRNAAGASVGVADYTTVTSTELPEAQWAIVEDGINLDQNTFTLQNRENKTVQLSGVQLRQISGDKFEMTTSATSNIKRSGDPSDIVILTKTALKDVDMFDGYMQTTENALRNEKYYLGQYHGVAGNSNAYFVENHTDKASHQIGMTAEKEDAQKWNLRFAMKADDDNKYTEVDTVFVETVFLTLDSDGKQVTDPKKKTKSKLAILPYTFQNATNREFVYFNNGTKLEFYACDPDNKDNSVSYGSGASTKNPYTRATRFALKKKPNNTYNFVTIAMAVNEDTPTALEDNKLYVANSADKGSLKKMNAYAADQNSLMVVEPAEAPEYHKIAAAWGDTIRLYRNENNDQVLYEKHDYKSVVDKDTLSFLNIDNTHQFSLNPAIFADTAYVNRTIDGEANTCYQYLLAVGVNPDKSYYCPYNPEHNTDEWRDEHNGPCADAKEHRAVYGRFLVNLIDTANVYGVSHLHNNPYINEVEAGEKRAKLSFVDGYHADDTLYVTRKGGETVKIAMDSPEFNVAKFAFRYTGDGKTFKIQTQYKDYLGDMNIEPKDMADYYEDHAASVTNEGYLKWINGTVVVEKEYENGDVFGIEENYDGNPTANESINGASTFSVATIDGAVVVKGAEGKTVTITNVLGQTVASTVISSSEATISVPAGVVVVAVEGEAAVKAIVK